MAMRKLVQGECGTQNPLMKTISHLSKEESHQKLSSVLSSAEDNSDVFVNEFFEQYGQQTNIAPRTFHMENLLQEMQEIYKGHIPSPVDFANTEKDWVEEFLNEKDKFDDSRWAQEFTSDETNERLESKWAVEYLENVEENKIVEFGDALDDNRWTEEFIAEHEEDLVKTASNLIVKIDDPKFSNSQFMKFIKKLASGESRVEGNKIVNVTDIENVEVARVSDNKSKGQIWVQDDSESNGSSFWDDLQKEWDATNNI